MLYGDYVFENKNITNRFYKRVLLYIVLPIKGFE